MLLSHENVPIVSHCDTVDLLESLVTFFLLKFFEVLIQGQINFHNPSIYLNGHLLILIQVIQVQVMA